MTDVRQMLLDLGVPRFTASMAIPQMFLMPGTTDPDNASTIEIIKGLQNGLRKIGYKDVRSTGVMNIATASAIQTLVPNDWMQATWANLYEAVLAAMKDPKRRAVQSAADQPGLGDVGYFIYDGVPPGPLPGYMVGLPPGPMGMGSAEYVSQSHPSAGRMAYRGVCRPTTSGSLWLFKQIQAQANRISSMTKSTLLSIDGDIGPGTTRAVNNALGSNFGCDGIASRASTIIIQLTNLANSVGAPTNVQGPAPRQATPAYRGSKTKIPEVAAGRPSSSAMNFLRQMSFAKAIPFFLIAGGVALYAIKRGKEGQ